MFAFERCPPYSGVRFERVGCTGKGSRIGIANDFPKEINEIHQKLYPVLKEAKKTKQTGKYIEVWRQDLKHYGLIMASGSADRGLSPNE